jgi:hypothetical protein
VLAQVLAVFTGSTAPSWGLGLDAAYIAWFHVETVSQHP